jgi:hypothetical protein
MNVDASAITLENGVDNRTLEVVDNSAHSSILLSIIRQLPMHPKEG